jgi:hypothetical protein
LLDENGNPIEGPSYETVDEAFRAARKLNRRVIIVKQEGEGPPVHMGYVAPDGWMGPSYKRKPKFSTSTKPNF